jgi:hypothetical protein
MEMDEVEPGLSPAPNANGTVSSDRRETEGAVGDRTDRRTMGILPMLEHGLDLSRWFESGRP